MLVLSHYASTYLSSLDPVKVFIEHHNSWLRQRAQMAFRYSDIGFRLDDREFNLFLSLTSISGAFLAVALPIVSDSGLMFLISSFIFLVEVFLGVGLMLIVKFYSNRILREDKEWVDQQYINLIKSSSQLIDKAKAKTIVQKDVDDYYVIRDQFVITKDKQAADRKKQWQSRVLNWSWIFYLIFLCGITALFFNFF